MTAEEIVEKYREKWKIETLFKFPKQIFPLKDFIGENVNAIETAIGRTLIANLLFLIAKEHFKAK